MTIYDAGVTSDLSKEDSSEKREYYDYDAFWKDLIKRFFYDLLKRAVPDLYEKSDTTKEVSFLDTEFTDILNTGDPQIHKSAHYADFVIKVPLKNEGVAWILLHIEAQGPQGGNLAERMNNYRCLIYAHYRVEPVALAIITGGHLKEERFYSHSHFGTEIVYRYNNLVLEDLDDGKLQASDNPIDLALYAAKCASKAKEEIQKYKYLRTLTDLLTERGWDRDENHNLILFIIRIVNLKDKMLQRQYWEYRQQLDKEGKLMYEPFLKEVEERVAEERGEEGKAREIAKKLLVKGDYSPEVISEIAGLPVERVRTLMN